jgi:hypothetical protein
VYVVYTVGLMGEIIHLIEKHVQSRGSNGENMRVHVLPELLQADIVVSGVVPKTGAISVVFKSPLKQLRRTFKESPIVL